MLPRLLIAPLLFAAFAAPPAQAVPGGPLGTLELGRYVCEVPDTMDVTRGREMEGLGFSVVTTSSYRSHGTLGSYLRTGDSVVLTSGPRKGERFKVVSEGHLQKVDDKGNDNPLRCVQTSRNNSADPAGNCAASKKEKETGDRAPPTAALQSQDAAATC